LGPFLGDPRRTSAPVVDVVGEQCPEVHRETGVLRCHSQHLAEFGELVLQGEQCAAEPLDLRVGEFAGGHPSHGLTLEQLPDDVEQDDDQPAEAPAQILGIGRDP
jgi:hypothetical protein